MVGNPTLTMISSYKIMGENLLSTTEDQLPTREDQQARIQDQLARICIPQEAIEVQLQTIGNRPQMIARRIIVDPMSKVEDRVVIIKGEEKEEGMEEEEEEEPNEGDLHEIWLRQLQVDVDLVSVSWLQKYSVYIYLSMLPIKQHASLA